MDVSQYNDYNVYDPNAQFKKWNECNLNSWLNGYGTDRDKSFIETAFSDKEKSVILTTRLENGRMDDSSTMSETWDFTNDSVFVLSLKEVLNTAYGFVGTTAEDSMRKVEVTDYARNGGHIQTTVSPGQAPNWWLRTGKGTINVWEVTGTTGQIGDFLASTVLNVRPAFNLDLRNVLFTSKAAVSWPLTIGSLTSMANTDTADKNEWKITLKDNTRSSFTVTDPKPATARSDGNIEIHYSGAQTGNNEYVSAILADDKGSLRHYGHIAQNSASGNASVKMPDGLTDGSYTLKVFSQQCNGAYKTDYASNFADVQITIDNTKPTLTAGQATRTNETAATVTFTSSEAGSYAYLITENGAAAPNVTDIKQRGITGTCEAAENSIPVSNLAGAGTKKIHIAVTDAAGNVSDVLSAEIPAYEASTDPSTEPENPSTDPTNPSTDPTEPSTDPTNPTAPTDPTNPTNPTDPTRPTNPTSPTSPALPVHQHSFGAWTVTAAATCTEAGKEERVCATCGQRETRKIPAAGHDWNADYTADKEPTCTEAGSRSIHCRNCDAQQNAQAIPALGHSFTKYVSDGNAAINQDGTETAKCDRCEMTDTRIEQGSALARQPGTSQQEQDQAQKLFVKTKPVLKLETISASKIKVSWNAVKGAKGYAIYRADSKNGKYKRIKTISTAKTRSFIDGKRQAGKSYSYKVRAYQKDKSGKTIWSAASKTVTQKAAPAAPKQVKTAAKKGYAAVAWKTVKGADKYRVYRSTEKNGKYIRMWETVHPAFQDKKVKAGRTYYYKVAALKQNGKTKIRGAASGIVKVTIK